MKKSQSRRGFTLVELLATMAIIAILATAMVSALSQAKESARKMRTRQLIVKVHQLLMPQWESFQTRRLPITVPAPNSAFPQTIPQNPYLQANQYGRAVAWYRLWALRELMRMEMPDRYDDLLFTPESLVNQVSINGQAKRQPVTPGLKLAYLRRIASLKGVDVGQVEDLIENQLELTNSAAESLYLVLSVGAADQDLYAMTISTTDLGDTDQDGVPELLDAWGNPISFLRWAPGFKSDLQPVYSVAQSSPGARQLPSGLPTDPNQPQNILTRFPVEIDSRATSIRYTSLFNYNNNHDAFDPLEVDPGPLARQSPERGYNLIPLIFSAGPNGSLFDILNGGGMDAATGYGIYSGQVESEETEESPLNTDPYHFFNGPGTGGQSLLRGAVVDNSMFDNIHNHLVGGP